MVGGAVAVEYACELRRQVLVAEDMVYEYLVRLEGVVLVLLSVQGVVGALEAGLRDGFSLGRAGLQLAVVVARDHDLRVRAEPEAADKLQGPLELHLPDLRVLRAVAQVQVAQHDPALEHGYLRDPVLLRAVLGRRREHVIVLLPSLSPEDRRDAVGRAELRREHHSRELAGDAAQSLEHDGRLVEVQGPLAELSVDLLQAHDVQVVAPRCLDDELDRFLKVELLLVVGAVLDVPAQHFQRVRLLHSRSGVLFFTFSLNKY